MKKQLHVIYVPGLGDHNVYRQRQAVNTWRFWGVTSEVFQVKWAESDWDIRFEELLSRIDELSEKGKDVGLVGASAGAGAVINAYAARKNVVAGAVLIAGKVNYPGEIGGSYRKYNAFINSAHKAVPALNSLSKTDRQRILSRFGIIDPIVPASHSIIPGARNRAVPSIGHIMTIATQITLGAPSSMKFLKIQAAKSN